jgi:hypothetical protein
MRDPNPFFWVAFVMVGDPGRRTRQRVPHLEIREKVLLKEARHLGV